MKKAAIVFTLCINILCLCFGQISSISFKSTDTILENRFSWAKEMALHYKGNSNDPVGPWYEAALPGRSAFCMRDVSHQSLGAEILGLHEANKNMFKRFASNISESKDWCSYWEINNMGVPAPADYRNDKEFWYNLTANFDIMYAAWKLYLWTGDEMYIKEAAFKNFYSKSVTDYITRWTLQADSLLIRPKYLNAPTPFNIQDEFHRCRGLPSYFEGLQSMKMGIDLLAGIYRGTMTYSAILTLRGNRKEAKLFEQKAIPYLQCIENEWWDNNASLYNTYYSEKNEFGKTEGETWLLWFDVLRDTLRTRKTIEHLVSKNWNIENLSYFPYLMYKYGYWENAYNYILYLTDPTTDRREYPEVSYGVIQGFVLGLMGVDADARYNRLSTLFRNKTETSAELDDLPILKTTVNIKHTGNKKSTLLNKGKKVITWRAMFAGNHAILFSDGSPVKAMHTKDWEQNIFSFIDVEVKPGKIKTVATVK